MVTKKAAGKKTGKLKLKKETLKDLNVKGKAGNVKGGNMVTGVTGVCPVPARTHACPITANTTQLSHFCG
jgi:hypothetical protein